MEALKSKDLNWDFQCEFFALSPFVLHVFSAILFNFSSISSFVVLLCNLQSYFLHFASHNNSTHCGAHEVDWNKERHKCYLKTQIFTLTSDFTAKFNLPFKLWALRLAHPICGFHENHSSIREHFVADEKKWKEKRWRKKIKERPSELTFSI